MIIDCHRDNVDTFLIHIAAIKDERAELGSHKMFLNDFEARSALISLIASKREK